MLIINAENRETKSQIIYRQAFKVSKWQPSWDPLAESKVFMSQHFYFVVTGTFHVPAFLLRCHWCFSCPSISTSLSLVLFMSQHFYFVVTGTFHKDINNDMLS